MGKLFPLQEKIDTDFLEPQERQVSVLDQGIQAYPFVSVIVPVYNDLVPLQRCLLALETQSYPWDRYEVIVVDNGSDQDIAEAISQFAKVTVFYEHQPGSYAARNRGIYFAKGEIVGFTDADCVPEPNWIKNGVRRLSKQDNCGLIAGHIKLFFKDPQKPTMVELYDSILAFPQKEFLERQHFGATANVFTYKRVLEDVGYFNSQLKSSGDLEWGQRVFSSGYHQAYCEDVVVHHPARSSFPQLYQRAIRHIGGRFDRLRSSDLPGPHQDLVFASMLIQNLIPPVMFFLYLLNDSRLPRIDQKLQVCYILTCVRLISAVELLRLRFGHVSARK